MFNFDQTLTMRHILFILFLYLCSCPLIAQLDRAVIYTIDLANMPEPVSNNAVVQTRLETLGSQTFVYSFGGIDSTKSYSGIHNKCWKYSEAEDTWTALPPIPDSLGRIAAAATIVDTIAYVIGGYHVFEDGQELSFDDVFRFDLINEVWLENGTPVPVPIDDHVQVKYKDSLIYVITGWSGSGFSGTNVANVQIYDPANDSWTEGTPVPSNNQYKAFGASGTLVGDTIFYFGGAKISGFSFLPANELRKGVINPDDPTEIEWSVTPTDQTAYRSVAWRLPFVYTQVDVDPILWLGGSANTYNYDGIAYDGSGGVPPVDSALFYLTETQELYTFENWEDLPNELAAFRMDLRTATDLISPIIIIAGGMEADQKVTAKTTMVVFEIASSIEETTDSGSILVYPSPTNGQLNWQNTFNEPIDWRVYNSNGSICYETITLTEGMVSTDFQNQVPGVYLLCAFNESGLLVQSAKFAVN